VLSRVLYGSRVSLVVGFAAVVVGGLVGATLGLLAGFRGGMIQEGREYLDSAWWISTFPGIVLMATSLVVSRTGDWLRDLLDPTLRGE